MKILITGCYGLIGSNLCKKLLPKNKIIGIDNFSSGNKNTKKINKIHFFSGSITNEKVLKESFKLKPDIVIHTAANSGFNGSSINNQEKELDTNVKSTIKLLKFSKKNNVKQFIFLSSSCVYGNGSLKKGFDEKSKIELDTPYAISKFSAEEYVKFYSKLFSLDYSILRIFNTYGPGEFKKKYNNVIFNFLYRSAYKKNIILYVGKRKNYRSFCFVEDIVDGIIKCINNKKAFNNIFNLGSSKQISIEELAKKFIKKTDDSNIINVNQRPWDKIHNRAAENSKAKKILNWKEKISLEEGIKITSAWMKKNIIL